MTIQRTDHVGVVDDLEPRPARADEVPYPGGGQPRAGERTGEHARPM